MSYFQNKDKLMCEVYCCVIRSINHKMIIYSFETHSFHWTRLHLHKYKCIHFLLFELPGAYLADYTCDPALNGLKLALRLHYSALSTNLYWGLHLFTIALRFRYICSNNSVWCGSRRMNNRTTWLGTENANAQWENIFGKASTSAKRKAEAKLKSLPRLPGVDGKVGVPGCNQRCAVPCSLCKITYAGP